MSTIRWGYRRYCDGDTEVRCASGCPAATTQTYRSGAHRRYAHPPALANTEQQGFAAIRKWAAKFYPEGKD